MNANLDTDNKIDELHRSCFSIYDESFRDKLVNVFPNVVVAPPEKAFERSQQDGKVKLPLISLYRMSNHIDTSNFNHFEAFHGQTLRNRVTPQEAYAVMKTISVTIMYQVDIWAQFRSYADNLFREVFYYLLRNPDLIIRVNQLDHPAQFALNYQDMDQPTDYESFEERNIIHRYTLNYELPRARLFYESESAKMVKSIPIELIPIKSVKTSSSYDMDDSIDILGS